MQLKIVYTFSTKFPSRYRYKATLKKDKDLYLNLDILILCFSHSEVYAIDSICSHSGGPLYSGDIEDLGTHKAIICPYHEYDFSLVDGASDNHDSKVVIYPVIQYNDNVLTLEFEDYDGYIVEESTVTSVQCDVMIGKVVDQTFLELKPTCIVEWAVLILNTPQPARKVELTNQAVNLWNSGQLPIRNSNSPMPPDEPPRESTLNIIKPWQTNLKGKTGSIGGKIAIIHSLCNIEQWAIDLAWDMIARFHEFELGEKKIQMPSLFISDFVRMALEEAKHFSMLSERLISLGSFFGALSVHNGLWESAKDTKNNILERLAIVHMVHEARGLDVNPNTIQKFKTVGDLETVQVLEIIHSEEITHVATGHKWFSNVCAELYSCDFDKVGCFQDIVGRLFNGKLKPPFNKKDRMAAGLSEDWYIPMSK